MKWDPAWADLQDSLSQRLDLLQPYHSATVGWIRQVEERPHYLDAMGDLLERIADQDRIWPEMIFAAASIADEQGVKDGFRHLSGEMQQIGRSAREEIAEETFGIDPPKSRDAETECQQADDHGDQVMPPDWRTADLTSTQRDIIEAIELLSGESPGEWMPSEQVAKRAGCNPSTVRKYAPKLKEWIKSSRNGYRLATDRLPIGD